MMRRGRHLVPKREGLAPLMVCMVIIPLSPSVARVFREPQELFSGISVTGRLSFGSDLELKILFHPESAG